MIFTIGYGSSKKPRLPALKIDELAHIREQLGAVIVDVRARPHSRWRPEMNCPAMERRFPGRYVSMAATLGNQTRSLPGKVDPDGIAWLQEYLDGLENSGFSRQSFKTYLLMCLEKPPGDCHRHHAIAMQLPEDSVVHLYHDGEEWTAFEAHELQRAIDEDTDYRCLPCGDPFNADCLRAAGVLPWPDATWRK